MDTDSDSDTHSVSRDVRRAISRVVMAMYPVASAMAPYVSSASAAFGAPAPVSNASSMNAFGFGDDTASLFIAFGGGGAHKHTRRGTLPVYYIEL
jgi:hypothetical protein